MSLIKMLWKRINEALHGFVVCVEWEGKTIRHEARSEAAALEWMACYPRSAKVFIWSMGDDSLVSSRS